MNFLNMYRYLNLFILIVDIISAIWIFYEPRKHNPYKYRRVMSCLGQAVCFMFMLSPLDSIVILPASVIGYAMIFLDMYLDHKDMPYSNERFADRLKKRERRR